MRTIKSIDRHRWNKIAQQKGVNYLLPSITELDCHNLQIIIYDDFNEFSAEKYRFDELLQSSGSIYPFTMFEWLEAWWEAFGSPQKLWIIVVTQKNSEEWIGILPLVIKKHGPFNLWVKTAEPIGCEYADYYPISVVKNKGSEILPILFECAMTLLPKNCTIVLRHWPIDDENFSVMNDYLINSGIDYKVIYHTCPVLYLSVPYDEIRKKWGKKHRNDVNRQFRRLQELGQLKLKVFSDYDDISSNLNIFLKLYKEKWKEDGFASKFESPKMQNHYMLIADKMRTKSLHFSALLLNDEPISYHFGFQLNGWFYYYKPVYNIEYKRYSPGKVHVDFLIKDGYKHKWKAFDFLKGTEPYKFLWTSNERQIASFFVNPFGKSITTQWLTDGKDKAYKYVGKYYRKAKLFFQKQ